jgi:uncharacterized membrane protein
MPDIETHLTRWQSAGVIDAATADRIRAHEASLQKPAGLRWQGLVALILGAILLACGVVLFVNAHWDQMSPGARFALVLAMVSVFHLGGAMARESFRGLSTTLHAVGTVSTGAAIALVGQIFNIQEHWPAAILMWAVAALAGWALLRDEAQQILALLLFPAWMICEWSYNAEHYIGQEVYIGRILIAWAALYLTVFLGSNRKIVRGILFAAAAIASIAGTELALSSWRSWYGNPSFLPLRNRVWGWIIIAALPLLFALFRRSKSLVPVVVAIGFGLVLPWCNRYFWDRGNNRIFSDEPSVAGYLLMAGFAIFFCWWGVRHASRALVNLGIVAFAIDVAFFYSNDIFDKIGRSLGLIGLGILFLAGGWALEKTRRRLIAHMQQKPMSDLPEAQ